MTLKKTNSLWFIIAAALLLLGMANWYIIQSYLEEKQPQTVHVNMATDISDKQKLAGIAENVFVGKVIAQTGTKSLSEVPETQFKVKVIENIKGNLAGSITVNQQGGYNDKQELVLVEGDRILQANQTYLFATRHLDSENWHTVVPVYGDVLLSSPEKHQKALNEMKYAVKNEKKFTLDNNK